MDARTFEEHFKRNEIKPLLDLSKLYCQKCAETGFVWLKYNHEGVVIASWAYCNCPDGRRQYNSKPFAIKALASLNVSNYKLMDFPIKCFLPDPFIDSIQTNIKIKMREFLKSVKDSEEFWGTVT